MYLYRNQNTTIRNMVLSLGLSFNGNGKNGNGTPKGTSNGSKNPFKAEFFNKLFVSSFSRFDQIQQPASLFQRLKITQPPLHSFIKSLTLNNSDEIESDMNMIAEKMTGKFQHLLNCIESENFFHGFMDNMLTAYLYARYHLHDADPRITSGEAAYIHSLDVVLNLIEMGIDPVKNMDMYIAAMNHDTLEDSKRSLSYQKLREDFSILFGAELGVSSAQLVGVLSKPKFVKGGWVFYNEESEEKPYYGSCKLKENMREVIRELEAKKNVESQRVTFDHLVAEEDKRMFEKRNQMYANQVLPNIKATFVKKADVLSNLRTLPNTKDKESDYEFCVNSIIKNHYYIIAARKLHQNSFENIKKAINSVRDVFISIHPEFDNLIYSYTEKKSPEEQQDSKLLVKFKEGDRKKLDATSIKVLPDAGSKQMAVFTGSLDEGIALSKDEIEGAVKLQIPNTFSSREDLPGLLLPYLEEFNITLSDIVLSDSFFINPEADDWIVVKIRSRNILEKCEGLEEKIPEYLGPPLEAFMKNVVLGPN